MAEPNTDPFQTFKDAGTNAFNKGEYDKAILSYTEALAALNENSQPATDAHQKRAVLYLNICMCHYKLGRLAQSLGFVDQALQQNPEYVKAYYRRGVILKDLKNYEDSIASIKKLLAIDPANKEAKDLLEQVRNKLVEEDNENKDLILFLEKELKETNKEQGLKTYQQYLTERLESPEEALKILKKFKLNEVFLQKILTELGEKKPDSTKLHYLLSYVSFFYQTLFKNLLELRGQQPSEKDLKFVETFNELSHNSILLEIFEKFHAAEPANFPMTSNIHDSLIKLFKFLRLINISERKDVEAITSLLFTLLKYYKDDKTHCHTVLIVIKSCFRINLACALKEDSLNAEILDAPLVTLIQNLCAFMQEQRLLSHYESLVMGINFYLKVKKLTKYEEFTQCSLYTKGIADNLIVIYSLLLVSHDIGNQHFNTLFSQTWGTQFLKAVFDPHTEESQRKINFEVLSLYLREAQNCKDLVTRKGFMDTLVNAFTSEKQPLFQLKITVLLIKIALRHPSEDIIKQFETALSSAYLGILIDFLTSNSHKEATTVLEFVELILGLSYVEDFKLRLSKIPILFEALHKFIPLHFEEHEQKFSLNMAIILFLVNMLTDAKEENFAEQQKKYNIQEEDLLKLEEVISRSEQGQKMVSKYNHDYIVKANIPKMIVDAVNIEDLCRATLNVSEFIKSSKLLRASLPKLLNKISSYNKSERSKLVRRDIIRTCLLIWDNTTEFDIKEEIGKFFSGIFVSCNADLFEYAEAIQIVDILAFALLKSSHELTTFEATSSLVQFSSLNDDVGNRLLSKHRIWGNLVLNLSEDNDFIIHATLELINNLSLNESFQSTYPNMKTIDRECVVLKALMTKYYQDYIQMFLESDPVDFEEINELKLFGKYNSIFQKYSLMLGIPLFLNFSKELVAKFETPGEFAKIFQDICQLLIKINEAYSEFFDIHYRNEITDFVYKLSLIIESQEKQENFKDLKGVILQVTQVILAPYAKEFSPAEHKKFNETISRLSS